MDLYRDNNPYSYNDKTTDTEPDPELTPTPYKTDTDNNTTETTADSMSETTQTTAQPIELKLAPPILFDGNQSETCYFISKSNLYLRVNSDIFNNDMKQIGFALSYMKGGTARPWKETKIAETDWGTWANFKATLLAAFSPADEAGAARAALKVLCQTTIADEYIAEFCTLTTSSSLTEDASLIEYFIEGISHKLVEKIFGLETVPTTIASWYTYALHFDNQWHCACAIINCTKDNDKDKKLFYKPKNYVTPKYTPPTHDPDAMDIDHLTQEERNDHMKKGLCFDCHQPGHRAVDYKSGPLIPKKTTNPFTNQKETGAETYAKICTLMGKLDNEEKEKALKQMEDEGF
ncbi:hypothetical protein DXG03_001610 [Asterophora parasitica]|uniref:Retrotransposon gag domain-containing protein n=1 Tax=Asterophora parasitica TaxID=117018 RepID=A0A9P7K7I4_9AGAR|nr:hypothetical protein DXG03_001610 [Asterophora parasitica]